jgi:hypothetical protein
MKERGSPPADVLVVRFAGCSPIVLRPGDQEFTFGRGTTRTLRFAHDSAGGKPDLEVSRNVGTIRWENGLWWVCNDSTTRPFDIIVQGVRIPLWPRSSPTAPSIWAVSPPGLEIRVDGPFGPYRLQVTVGPLLERPPASPSPDEDFDASTGKRPTMTGRDRLILAAKFLALPIPGDAVGDQEAAEYANAALPASERPVTVKAVEDCVRKWRDRLKARGVTDIEGQPNIHNLGRKLLAWGLLRQEDRRILRP